MIVRGWDACGLLAPYKPELKDECHAKAMAAMSDPEHAYYPLFPNHDRTAPPPGGEEPTPDPVEVGDDSSAPTDDPEQRSISERAEAIMAMDASASAAAAPAKRARSEQPSKLFPIFAKQAKIG